MRIVIANDTPDTFKGSLPVACASRNGETFLPGGVATDLDFLPGGVATDLDTEHGGTDANKRDGAREVGTAERR